MPSNMPVPLKPNTPVETGRTGHELLKRRVASLMARRFDLAEIVQLLSEEYRPDARGLIDRNPTYFVNPQTGKPYSDKTIRRVRDEILAEWQRQDADKLDQMFAGIIGALDEIERRAYALGDYYLALQIIDRKLEIINRNRPIKIDLSVLNRVDWDNLSGEQLQKIAAGDLSDIFG